MPIEVTGKLAPPGGPQTGDTVPLLRTTLGSVAVYQCPVGLLGGGGGTYAAVAPIGIAGSVISLIQSGATAGQVLSWNGTNWAPGTISGSGAAYTATAPLGISGTLISLLQGGAATGQALVWNGSAWGPATISGGGTAYTGTGFIGISGSVVSFVQNGATIGQVPTWNGSAWTPATPSGGSTAITPVIIDGATIPGSSGTPYVMQTVDRLIYVNKTTGAATSVTLPASPTIGAGYDIIDGKGDAGTNNINITAPGGGLINGSVMFSVNVNRAAATLKAINATTWSVV